MKKNIVKKIISFCMILMMVFSILNINHLYAKEQKITSFEYSIDSSDYEWQFMSIQEKREALVIPEEVLGKMTDSCLLEAFLKYPFVCDILISSAGNDRCTKVLKKMSNYCSAYQEILRRGLTVHEMLFSLEENNVCLRNSKSVDSDIDAKEIMDKIENSNKYSEGRILLIKDVISELQTDALLNPVIYKKLADRAVASSYVTTPRGTVVEVLIQSDILPLYEREKKAKDLAIEYGIEYIAPATVTYNCHSYAWYWQSTNNMYWMPDPGNYMRDGSYKKGKLKSFSQTAADAGLESGQKIYYGTPGDEHSAIVEGPIRLGDAVGSHYGVSKFGSMGLYRHKLGDVPYFTSNVSSWR